MAVSTGTTNAGEPTLAALIAKAVAGESLSVGEAEAAFNTLMEGRATPVQTAALLIALRAKGEQPAEVAGGVRALRNAMIPVSVEETSDIVDTCGTGGGTVTTFNISTAAAFVAAGAGARIAKHGNRSFTSRCGSADVLTELGVDIDLRPDAMGRILEGTGIVFMFAPLLHPAMRHVAPVRRELGVPTIMNILGPLTNPAGARRQVVGVADPGLLDLIAEALQQLGHLRALVVHGEPGLDEISPIGVTTVVEVAPDGIRRYPIDARELIADHRDHEALAGGDPAHNAAVILRVLSGEQRGAARAAIVVNAAAALLVADRAESIDAAIPLAERSIDEGRAIAALDALRTATAAERKRAGA